MLHSDKYTRHFEPTDPAIFARLNSRRAMTPMHDRELTSQMAAAIMGISDSKLRTLRCATISPMLNTTCNLA